MRLSIILLLSSVLWVPYFSYGGAGSHGGNTSRSTPEQVKLAVTRDAQMLLPGVFAHIRQEMNQRGEALHISDPALREVFSAMLGSDNSLDIKRIPALIDLSATPFKIKDTGVCFDGSKPRDASVLEYKLKSEMCISVTRLTRIPTKALAVQISALLIHELAHHFGFNEDKAQKVQKFVLTHIFTSDCFIEVDIRSRDDEAFLIYPKELKNLSDANLIDTDYLTTRVVFDNEFNHAPGGSGSRGTTDSIKYETANSPNEFDMNITRNGHSALSFQALNRDHSRSHIEISWTGPIPNGPMHDIEISGTLNGQNLTSSMADGLHVAPECYYEDENSGKTY